MRLVAANAARMKSDALFGEKREGTTGKESRGCNDEEGKFWAALSGKGWLTLYTREASEEMEGDYGPTR